MTASELAAPGLSFLPHGVYRYRHPPVDVLRRRAAAAKRRGLARLHAGVRNLRHAQRRAQQCRAGVPCAERQPPCRRQLCRRAQQRRLVGQPGRAGQAAGHRQALRHRRQQPRLLLRQHRADEPEPATARPALRRRLPGGDGGRLGRCAGAAARRAGHHAAGRGDRRQPRRHAGAGLDAALSRARAPLHRRGHGAQPVGAEHRLQRGGAPRHRHRPRFPRRPLPAPRRGAQARAARGAHAGPHHLPVRRLDGRQVRARSCARPSRPTARRTSSSRSRATCATRPTSSASTSTPTPTC